MNLDKNLLRLKKITPLQKLILGLIMDVHPIVIQFERGYSKTCGDIAKKLGTTRAKVLKAIEALLEMEYITTEVSYRMRITNLTPKFESLVYPF